MNPFSKAYQCRPKATEAKPEKQRAHNSTLAAPSKPMNKVGKRGRKLSMMDGFCADAVMARDGFECVACFALERKRVTATVVHHVERKRTHKGVEKRFELGYQVALCERCHQDQHAQNGFSNRLELEVEPSEGDRVEQQFKRGELVGVRQVTNWNPFAGDAE